MSNSKLLLTVKFVIIHYALYYVDSSHPETVGRTLITLLPYLLCLCLCSGHRQDLESETVGITTSLSGEISRPFFFFAANFSRVNVMCVCPRIVAYA